LSASGISNRLQYNKFFAFSPSGSPRNSRRVDFSSGFMLLVCQLVYYYNKNTDYFYSVSTFHQGVFKNQWAIVKQSVAYQR